MSTQILFVNMFVPKTAVVVVVIRYMVERQQWPFHGLQHQASCRAPTLVNEPLHHYPTTLHAWNIAKNTLCCTDERGM